MPESPCQRYGLLRLPKVTERRDGPRPGDNDDDDDCHEDSTVICDKTATSQLGSAFVSKKGGLYVSIISIFHQIITTLHIPCQ